MFSLFDFSYNSINNSHSTFVFDWQIVRFFQILNVLSALSILSRIKLQARWSLPLLLLASISSRLSSWRFSIRTLSQGIQVCLLFDSPHRRMSRGPNVGSRSFPRMFHFPILILVSFLFRILFLVTSLVFWIDLDWFLLKAFICRKAKW